MGGCPPGSPWTDILTTLCLSFQLDDGDLARLMLNGGDERVAGGQEATVSI